MRRWAGAPGFSRELDFSRAKETELTIGFSRGKSCAKAKAHLRQQEPAGALMRSSPRMIARAPTESLVPFARLLFMMNR